MLHPHTELAFIDDRIGYGVVATRAIPRGTITWVLDELDQRIPPHRVRRLSTLQRKHLDKYAYVDRTQLRSAGTSLVTIPARRPASACTIFDGAPRLQP
jgi:hypothetical protein